MCAQQANVVFMGSPQFALPALEALNASGRYKPLLVVSQPDKKKGRGKILMPTPCKAMAHDLGITCQVMSKGNYVDVVAEIARLKPDFVVVAAFGIILKEDLLNLPRCGCINIHASLLPKYRGASPIQAALLAGDEETGCTTMRMDAGIDTGEILLQESLKIEPDDNAGTLSFRLALLGADLLVRTLDGIQDGSVVGVAQDDLSASYTKMIKKSDGEIDWSLDSEALERRIRAMTPWPSAFTFCRGKRLIVAEAVAEASDWVELPPAGLDASAIEPGVVLSLDPLTVACGEGAMVLERVKPEGRKEMHSESFLAGNPLEVGERLG